MWPKKTLLEGLYVYCCLSTCQQHGRCTAIRVPLARVRGLASHRSHAPR